MAKIEIPGPSNSIIKQGKEITIIKQDIRKDLSDLLSTIQDKFGINNPSFFRKLETLITHKNTAVELDSFRLEFLNLLSEYGTDKKHNAIVPVEGLTNSTDSIIVNQDGEEANLATSSPVPIESNSTDNTNIDTDYISRQIIGRAREKNALDFLDLYLYNIIPYAMGSLYNQAINLSNSIGAGNIPDLFSQGVNIGFGINKMKYYTVKEIALLFGATNFYVLHFHRGMTIKDMYYPPVTEFSIDTVTSNSRMYLDKHAADRYGLSQGQYVFDDILYRKETIMEQARTTNYKVKVPDERTKDGRKWNEFLWEELTFDATSIKSGVMINKRLSTEVDVKAEDEQSQYKIFKRERRESGKWNKQREDEGYKDKSKSLMTFDEAGNLDRREVIIKKGGLLSEEIDVENFRIPKKRERVEKDRWEAYSDETWTDFLEEVNRDRLGKNLKAIFDREISIDLTKDEVSGYIKYQTPEGEKVSREEARNILSKKTDIWQIGSLYIWPIDQPADKSLNPAWVPFEFNPTIEESSRGARYQATQILSRMGDLQSYTGTDGLTITFSTQYVPTSRKWSEVTNEQREQFHDSWVSTFDMVTIQYIEMAYRSLVMPYYREANTSNGTLYTKPPLIKIIMGDKDEVQNPERLSDNQPFYNLLCYPNEIVDREDVLQSERNLMGEGAYRHFRTFVVTSVQILKNLNEQPLFIEKGSGETPYLKDTMGFTVNMTLVEISPNYMDVLPNFTHYYGAAYSYYNSLTPR